MCCCFVITGVLVLLYRNTRVYRTREYATYNDSLPASAKKRLVMAFEISEQMTMAILNTYHLARFAAEWKASTVLPVVIGDHLGTLPNINGAKRLDMLFNVSQLNAINKKLHLPFVDFETFLKESDRRNVYFFYIKYRGTRRGTNYEQRGGSAVKKCDKLNAKSELRQYLYAITSLNNEARLRGLPVFQLSLDSCCTVNPSIPTTPNGFITGCNIELKENFTILIDEWRGYYSPKDESIFKYKRLYVPKDSSISDFSMINTPLPHSIHVQKNTEEFLLSLTNGEDFIGVHIRAQKLEIQQKNGHDEMCIRKLIEQVKKSFNEHRNIKRAVYIADRFVDKYSQLLKSVTFAHFQPSDPNFDNPAFIAQVEQNTLSKAKVLIMCGGGTFERMISLRYKEANPGGEIRVIAGCGYYHM